MDAMSAKMIKEVKELEQIMGMDATNVVKQFEIFLKIEGRKPTRESWMDFYEEASK